MLTIVYEVLISNIYIKYLNRNFVFYFDNLVRLLIQFINGILTNRISRNNEAYQILKDLLTNNCHLRYDELAIIMENIFRHLNRDDDDNNNTNSNQNLSQQTIKVKKN